MTKLAFLVVYVFDAKTRPLFDIHLERIRRHTRIEFRIFAAAHKLSDEMRSYVHSQPEIETVDCAAPPHFHVRLEHAHCLETLAEYAMSRDFTHCMSIHLDSFPISDDWLDNLLQSLDEGAALASIVPNGYSAGLLWPRAFYESRRPKMLLSEEEHNSAGFSRFKAEFPTFDHVETGLGYIFRAWDEGLPWRQIQTDAHRKIYDGIFYHMVGATFNTWTDVQPIRRHMLVRILWHLIRPGLRLLPVGQRRVVRELFIDKDVITRDGSVRSKREEIALLMHNPDHYIESVKHEYSASKPSSLSR